MGEGEGRRGRVKGGRSHLEVLPLALQDGSLEEEDLLGGQAAVTVGGEGKGKERISTFFFFFFF